jgi:hypothetical protein
MERAEKRGHELATAAFGEQAQDALANAAVIRELLMKHQPDPSTEPFPHAPESAAKPEA